MLILSKISLRLATLSGTFNATSGEIVKKCDGNVLLALIKAAHQNAYQNALQCNKRNTSNIHIGHF